LAREHDNREYSKNCPERNEDAFDTGYDEREPIMLLTGKRSTGKSQNEGKHCAEQEQKNSQANKYPTHRGGWNLPSGTSRRMVRQRDKDKSYNRVKQREKRTKPSHACNDIMKDRQ
jgi:hypothetical protein